MSRRRMFGHNRRTRYEVIRNPRNGQFTVQRIWGSGFGERLIVASFPTRSEAQAFVRKRSRGLG